MNVLLVDDHASFCEGLIAAIHATRRDYEVDFLTDAAAAIGTLTTSTEYDLFVIDLMMPGMGGIELIRKLSKASQTPIMVLSSVRDVAIIRQLFELGIIGYVPKSCSVHEVLAAIDGCRAGELHVPGFLAVESSPASADGEASRHPIVDLTDRQLEVLRCLDKGLSTQGIADTLFVSPATVKTHLNKLFKALGVTNRVSCLREARNLGLLPETSPKSSE